MCLRSSKGRRPLVKSFSTNFRAQLQFVCSISPIRSVESQHPTRQIIPFVATPILCQSQRHQLTSIPPNHSRSAGAIDRTSNTMASTKSIRNTCRNTFHGHRRPGYVTMYFCKPRFSHCVNESVWSTFYFIEIAMLSTSFHLARSGHTHTILHWIHLFGTIGVHDNIHHESVKNMMSFPLCINLCVDLSISSNIESKCAK